VAEPDDGSDHALAGIVLVVRLPMAEELVAQRRQDVDEPYARIGLRVADGDPAVGEIDVLPRQSRPVEAHPFAPVENASPCS